ncbi:MAG: T9SS type A sorting domain-containing protein [Flavobacteriales bacterium]|nr:T9SS type A sorting domain-containing protein [Flavobacteriales bacterium]
MKNKFLIFIFFITNSIFSQDLVSWSLVGSSANLEYIEDIKLDNQNNTLISGYLKGQLNSSYNFICSSCTYIAKYDSTGNPIWFHEMYNAFYSPRLAIDVNDNIYVTGIYSDTLKVGTFTLAPDTAFTENIFLMKLDSSGSVIWGKKITENAPIKDMLIDNNGNLVLAGFTRGISSFTSDTIVSYGGGAKPDILLCKFDTLGNFIWATHAGNSGFYSDIAENIAVDNNDNIFVVGEIRGTAYFDSIVVEPYPVLPTATFTGFVAKYNSNGNAIWAKPTCRNCESNAVASDDMGNCYIGGQGVQDLDSDTAQQTNISNEMYIAKLDGNGIHQWTKPNEQVTSAILYPSQVYDIVIDNNKVYATGYFSDTLLLSPNINLLSSSCSQGTKNIFLISLDLDGNSIWGNGTESCSVISYGNSLDLNNCVFAIGGYTIENTSESTYWENDSIYGMQSRDGLFITVKNLDCDNVTNINNPEVQSFNAFPNPIYDKLYIDTKEFLSGTIIISDYLGRSIINQKITSSKSVINLNHLKSGIYFVSIVSKTSNNHLSNTKRIIKL